MKEFVGYVPNSKTNFILFYNSDLRKLYIRKYYANRPSMFKLLLDLLKSENRKELTNLGIFIFKAFELRKNAVYLADIQP